MAGEGQNQCPGLFSNQMDFAITSAFYYIRKEAFPRLQFLGRLP
jgi:hypothetical protein